MSNAIEFYSNNVLLRGRFAKLTEASLSKLPLVVMVTGDGKKGSRSNTWSFLSKELLQVGIPSFVFDFQGLGYSEGPMAELNLTVGVENLRSAIEIVKQQLWVDPDRIGILGSSFGGNVAIIYGAKYHNIKTFGLKSPVSYYPEVHEMLMSAEGLSEWKHTGYNSTYGFNYDFYLDGFKYDTYALSRSITAPCLIVHGDADTEVPIKQSKKLANSWGGKDILEILPGVDHGYKEENAMKSFAKSMSNWFRQTL